MLFTVAVGLGPFAGVLALVMFSLAIMGKLLSETIDSIDLGPLEAAKASGAKPVSYTHLRAHETV